MYQNSKCMYRDSMYRCVRIGKYTDINVCARTPRMHHLFPYRITYLANMKNASEPVKLSSFKCFSKSSIDDPEIMHLRVVSFPPAKKKRYALRKSRGGTIHAKNPNSAQLETFPTSSEKKTLSCTCRKEFLTNNLWLFSQSRSSLVLLDGCWIKWALQNGRKAHQNSRKLLQGLYNMQVGGSI